MNKTYMFKSWLGLLNFFILQWFFIRLQRLTTCEEDDSCTISYSIIGPIVPLTGWWTAYIRL